MTLFSNTLKHSSIGLAAPGCGQRSGQYAFNSPGMLSKGELYCQSDSHPKNLKACGGK